MRHINENQIPLAAEGGKEEKTSGSHKSPDGESLMGPQPVGNTGAVLKTLTAEPRKTRVSW